MSDLQIMVHKVYNWWIQTDQTSKNSGMGWRAYLYHEFGIVYDDLMYPFEDVKIEFKSEEGRIRFILTWG